MKTTLKKLKYIIAALFVFVVTLISGQGNLSAFSAVVKAETYTYSNVLDDLKKDENFNVEAYPSKADDYSLDVIQIAESNSGELFLYVYQPSDESKDFVATSVNISVKENGKNCAHYDLELVSTESVFDKYLVKNLEVQSIVLRYYYITTIYRHFDESIDMLPTDDNVISHIGYSVGQLWTATTVNETVQYAVDFLELITIEEKHVGFIRYMDLHLFGSNVYTDSHYVAFRTDRKINTLLEAELQFWYADYYVETHTSFLHKNYEKSNEGEIEPIPVTKTLYREEIFSKESWFFDSYEYNRIQSMDEFLTTETEEFSEETKTALKNTDWVLRFYESGYSNIPNNLCGDATFPCTSNIKQYTVVSGVTILRLEYEYDGQVYSLGVVDNVSTGDQNPDNDNWDDQEKPDWLKSIEEWFSTVGGWVKTLFTLVFGAILLALLWPVLYPALIGLIKGIVKIVTFVFKWVGKGLWAVLKLIFRIISAPVRFVIWLITGK